MSTIVFPDHTSPAADAEGLRKACQGWGTDEKGIIGILGKRNAIQRKLIRQAYEDLYQEDLIKRLESELSGDFEKAVYRWALDPEDRDAVILHTAIKKTPTIDYRAIVEISCTSSFDELLAIKRAYQIRYKHSLEEDLAQRTTSHMRTFLVGLVSIFRYQGEEINARLANSEADILHGAICKEKAFTHEEIIRILTTRTKPQIIATLNHYKDDHGTSITKHLRDEQSCDYVSALRVAIRCICDHKKYYAKVIRQALNRAGTDEESLTRVVVTRAEKDLKEIKEVYHKRNSVTLDHAVAKDTSGDYKAFLLTLLGN